MAIIQICIYLMVACESWVLLRAWVKLARDQQEVLIGSGSDSHVSYTADMRPAEVRKFCTLDETGKSLMQMAMSQLQLSARGYHGVLKLARTIADLAGSEGLQASHLAEALQYRPRLGMIG